MTTAMRTEQTMRARAAACVVVLACSAASHAGSLTPPAGPPAFSPKPLTEIEPRTPINQDTTPGDGTATFVISQPGAYFLTDNVMGETGKVGIKITANDVSIDCRGFALIGPPDAGDAINADPAQRLVIRDGNISGWGGDGIDFSVAVRCRISDMLISDIAMDGINAGAASTVERVVVHGAGQAGIAVGVESSILECVVRNAGTDGFVVLASSTVSLCTVDGSGADGFQVGDDTTVSDSRSSNAAESNFEAGDECIVLRCASIDSVGPGIVVGERSTIRSALIERAELNGIIAGPRTVVDGVIVNEGFPTAIVLTDECVLNESVVIAAPLGQQALVSSNIGSEIRRNLLVGRVEGAAGVRLSESNNAVIQNHATGQFGGVGYDLTTFPVTRNLLIGNSSMGLPTSYDINAGNAFGEIIDVSLGSITLQAGPWTNWEWK